MSESDKTETQLENKSQSDEVTIVVTEDDKPESDVSTQVTKDSDPIWREIRGLRRQIALANRRSAKKESHSQVIAVRSSVTEVSDNGELVATEKSVPQKPIVSEVVKRADDSKYVSPFNSLFRKWR